MDLFPWHLGAGPDISLPGISEQISENVQTYLSYGLLCKGAFGNVHLDSSGVYGNANQSRLRYVDEPNYPSGTVWETFRADLIYESGIDYKQQPIAISGVYSSGIFVPITSTGVNSYKIDYARGRVIFNSPLSSETPVSMEYSYKYVAVRGSDQPWFRELQFNSFRIDQDFTSSSGNWSVMGQNRVALPAIVVEVVENRKNVPMMIGGGIYLHQPILFHVFSEDSSYRRISDMLCGLDYKTINFYDMVQVASGNAFALNWDGTLNSGVKQYPELIVDYFWKRAEFRDVSAQNITNNPFFYSVVVRCYLDIDMPEL